MATEKSTFAVLNAINCNEHTEKKNGLTYLSWAWAWQMVKANFPDATYTIYENRDGWNYHTDGRTCWVKTGVTIGGLEYIEDLPVMDSRNRSIPFESVTSFDVNKAIQRSLTKACARHGLGLYIYAGEDLPDAADDEARAEVKKARRAAPPKQLTTAQYYQIVRAYADGKFTASGGDYRETWILNYKPSAEQITQFDLDVQDYRAAKQDGVTQ
jgi:hypothetical protein